MKKNSPRFINFLRIAVLWAAMFLTSFLSAQVGDLDVGKGGWVIPGGEKETYQNVTLKNNSSVLEVNGTLIVNGNLVMDGNNSQFIMGPDALVVVYGNFIAHNQVNISVSSFLIVYGDFSQKTGSGQAEIDATNGNIYIFGEVDEKWSNFDTCTDYEGNVSELGTEACDYGTGDNFEDNFEDFPEEYKDAVNCYDLTSISNQEVCEGAQVIFSVAEITNAAVKYEWQEKTASTDWVVVENNPNSYSYTISNTSVEDSGKLFRVVVRPSDPTNSACKISISKKVLLTVITLPVPVVSSNSPVCEGGGIELSSSTIPGGTYQWTGPNGFTSSEQNPVIPNASQAKAGEYSLVVTNANGCSSNPQRTNVVVNNLPVPVLSSNSPVCEGSDIQLYSSISGGTYQWTGPNGFTSSTQNPVIPNASQAKAGDYSLVVSNASGCTSIVSHITISIINKSEWTGAEDTNWNNINNWSCNSLPTLSTNVTIPANLNKYPVVSTGSNALSKNLIIETGASVTVIDNWLRITGTLTNDNYLNASAGSISFEGASAQTIPAGAFENDRILNLNIDNSAGVTSEATIEIINSLKVEAGIFYTGNGLTLVSGETGTAYIDGSGTGQVSGTVTLQRYLSNAFGYKYFSTPFQNSTVDDLAANFDLTNSETGFPHLYEYFENRTYDEENDLTGWQKYLDLAAPLNPGTGYAINTSGATDALTLELSGIVNDGPIDVTLENNNGTYTNGFNLVGNPYPSPLDWDLMVEDLEGIDNGIHFFKASADNRYTGTYISYVDGVSTDPASGIIPSMQGFFVRVSDPDNGIYPATANLQFTNAARTGNQVSHSYYKAKNKAEVPQIRLSAGFENEENSDATVIYFRNGGTPEFEKEIDAQKILNTAVNVPSLYSLSSKKEKLSINAVSSLNTEAMEIPLGISAERSGEMRLVLSEATNLFPSLHIYLKDNKKKILKDLARDPEYSFTSQKGENNDRFVLVFSSEKLSPAEIAMAMEDFAVFNENKEFVVRLNLPYYEEGKVILSNMSGQVIQSKSGSGKEEVRFSGITASGMYLVTLTTENESQTKKVIIKE
ncbi:T9SS type A sorting domain-containing protein [Salinimicrobium sediminilitoris]|uniref:T9SS type A sorting domain-containing protein n=1 Tax=Salinimicrobium sediminilitoris TaxID=2876715 RepID=UPI001E5A4A71|nr:T9SS type A sorting domain-containing protein [Salinimicrobium sediminilitoris]MCC8358640.1 T9SS type A sorting domain-containing protein [Salinimicrobium sediminilitoris]